MSVDNESVQDILSDPVRLAALDRYGLLGSVTDQDLDRLTRLACRLLDTPISWIAAVAADRHFVASYHGPEATWPSLAGVPVMRALCERVVRSGGPVFVSDARQEMPPAGTGVALEPDLVAFGGVAICDPDGNRLGTICVTTPEQRAWTERDHECLVDLSQLATSQLRMRFELKAGASRARAHARTERRARRATLEARRNADRMDEAESLAQAGSWAWDPESDHLTVSRGLLRLLGLDRRPTTRATYESIVPADLRAAFLAEVRRSLRDDGTWEAEHPLLLADGRSRLLVSRGTSRWAPDGALHLLRGTLHDVTDARERDGRFDAAFWQAPIGAALLGLVGGERGRWLTANRELERLLRASPGQLAGMSIDDASHPEDLHRSAAMFDRLARGEARRTQNEQRLARLDGTWVIVEATHTVIRSAAGAPRYAIGHYIDAPEPNRHRGELAHLAQADPLTGAFNRRRFEDELDRTLARAERSRAPGALLLFELDELTGDDDRAGHDPGDPLLVRAAHSVAATLRAGDAFGRIGGDEFAILLPDADLAQARRVAERVLRIVRHRVGPGIRDNQLTVTASVGITYWGPNGTSRSQHLLTEADDAMHEAKSSGGNHYVVYAAQPDDLGVELEI